MGVHIMDRVRKKDKLYYSVANELGEKYTVVLSEAKENEYSLNYILIPTNEWNGEIFQETIEVRGEVFSHIREELNGSIPKHCLSITQQIIPKEFWEDVDIDLSIVGEPMIENTRDKMPQ